jgi:hypothetical protein
MADTRIVHRAAGQGDRTTLLTDFEYRVWVQYILSADDFGIMLASPLPLQTDSRSLRQRPTASVQKALERLIELKLVSTFEHQQDRFVWQPDWQDRQNIRYPRPSVLPKPPQSARGEASEKTRKLFEKRPGVHSEKFQSEHGERAVGGRESTTTNTHTNTHTGVDLPEGVQGEGDRSTSDVPPAWGHGTRRGSHGGHDTIINGRDQRRHGEHFGPGCDIGLCLLPAIQSDHRARLSKSNDCGPDGRTREQFYRDTVAAEHRRLDSGGQPCGDTPWEFWNKRFAEWLGVSPNGARNTTKGNRTVAAGRRVDEAYAAGALPNPFGPDGAVPAVPALTGRGER